MTWETEPFLLLAECFHAMFLSTIFQFPSCYTKCHWFSLLLTLIIVLRNAPIIFTFAVDKNHRCQSNYFFRNFFFVVSDFEVSQSHVAMQRCFYNASRMMQNKAWRVVSLNKNIYQAYLRGRIRNDDCWIDSSNSTNPSNTVTTPETLETYFKFYHGWLLSYVLAGNLPAFSHHPRTTSSGWSQYSHPWLSLYTEGTGKSFCSDLSVVDIPEIGHWWAQPQTVESLKVSSCRTNTYYLFIHV